MKPIRLEIEGLNSYKDKQIINFEKLTQRGIFGIFGDTGSGKSTILDGITLGMYGIIARDTNEFINSLSDEVIVNYEFEIGRENIKRRYQIYRSINKNKVEKAELLEIHNDGKKVTLAEKVEDVNEKIIQIIGLTSKEFLKAVILPQGKCSEFLKVTGTEKRNMLERIFGLEKYGSKLLYKVTKRKNLQLQKSRDLQVKLSQFKDVNEDLYINTLNDLEKFKLLYKNNKKELDLLQETSEENKDVYEKQLKLEKYELRKKELDLKSNVIKEKKIQLEKSINAAKVDPYISGVQALEKKITEDNTTIDDLEKKSSILKQELLILKNKYEDAYDEKNEKIPILSEEKIRLQRSLNMESEIINIDNELKIMKDKLNDLNIEKEKPRGILSDLESRRDILIKSIKETEVNLEKIKIDSKLKQKIFLAYDYEKQYNKIGDIKKQNEEKIENLINLLDEINLKSRYIQKSKEDVENRLENLQEHLNLLDKKYRGKNKDVLVKAEYISNLKLKVYQILLDEKKRDRLQDELNKVIEEKYNTEREVNVSNDKLENIKKEIIDLEKEIDSMRFLNLASELKNELVDKMPCPVCGSRHHENIDILNQDEKIAFYKTKLERKRKEKNEIKTKIEELNSKNSQCVIVEKIKLKELQELKGKIGELNSNQLSNKLDEEQRTLEILKKNIQDWEEDKKTSEGQISKLKAEKSEIEKDEIKLLNNINIYKNSIKELKKKVEDIENKLRKVKNEYNGLTVNIRVSNLCEKVDEINKNEIIIENLYKDYFELIKSRENINIEIKSYESELQQIEFDFIKTNQLFIEKKKYRDNKYNEVISITKGELSKNILDNLEDDILRITRVEEEAKKNLESKRIEFEKCLAEKNNIEGRLKTAKEQYKIQEQMLNKLLDENKFESIYAVKRALLPQEQMKKLGEEISEYEEEVRILLTKIKEMKQILNERVIKKEEFEKLKNNIFELKTEIGDISKNIGLKEGKLKTLKDSLEYKEELNKQYSIISHEANISDELERTIMDNKFVEYIAKSKLEFIVLEASKNLENMTKGKYSLEIDESLNFIIRDNFNGGKIRSVDTLSGGETFLTSLALALSLSLQIQLKGNSPLEILFIDEGFDTLDNNSLDIVMEYIENLQRDKLSIGIISHISELKYCVPINLLVKKDKYEDKTKIEIEYS